jgi:hypothetical protein
MRISAGKYYHGTYKRDETEANSAPNAKGIRVMEIDNQPPNGWPMWMLQAKNLVAPA